jgi:hypothetical protein
MSIFYPEILISRCMKLERISMQAHNLYKIERKTVLMSDCRTLCEDITPEQVIKENQCLGS